MLSTRNRIRIGEIGGHEIAIDPVTTAIIAFFLFSGSDKQWAAAVMVALFVSLLVHELGHAFAIRKLTGEHTLIILGGLGGVTLSTGTDNPRRQLWISLAGPGAGFVLGIAGWILSLFVAPDRYGDLPWQFDMNHSVWLYCLHNIVWFSLLWGAINLLPAYPLDGGQALRAYLLIRRVRARTAGRITRRLGMAIAVAAGIWAGMEGMPIAIFICAWIFMGNWEEEQREKRS